MDSDYIFKILLIGDSHVGKTCLLMKYTDDLFSEAFTSTIGVDFKIKTIQVDGKNVKLQIWDTAGQEKFKSITKAYYKNADGVIIVYDITDKRSFDNISTWLGEVDLLAEKDCVYKLLIGNKTDLENKRAVQYSTAKVFADEAGITLIETSAKSSRNISEVFLKMAEELKKKADCFQDIPIHTSLPNLDIRKTHKTEKDKYKCFCT